MQTLFDYPTDPKTRGIANAWQGTPDDWKVTAFEAVRELCRVKTEFTTDDLPADVRDVREPRALGALMVKARAAGLCECTDRMRESTSMKCHRRRKAVWRSMVFQAATPEGQKVGCDG